MSDARERDALRREVKELRSMFKASIAEDPLAESRINGRCIVGQTTKRSTVKTRTLRGRLFISIKCI